MTITEAANALEGQLQAYAEPRGGYAKVMANLRHLWEELYVIKEEPRILICYNGELPRSSGIEGFRLNRVDRQWMVVVVRGRGFKSINKVDGRAETFYDDLENIREECRKVTSITEADEWPVDYKGIRPLPNVVQSQQANAFADAFMIEFATGNDIPAIVDTAPATEGLSGEEL